MTLKNSLIGALRFQTISANAIDTIAEQMSRVTSRYYLTFCDLRLPWDGKPHDLVLTLDKTDLDQVAVVLPDHREASIAWWVKSRCSGVTEM